MTDNFEDHEHQETVHGEEAPPQGLRSSNLAEAWRTKPIFKLLVVMVVAGAAIAIGTTFFSGSKQQQMSHLVNPPDVHQAAGGAASPYFIQQTKEAEAQRSKEALEKGTSALPTPIGQPGDINVTEKTDPMNELRSETDHLKQQLAQMQQQQAQRSVQQQQQNAPANNAPRQPEQFDPALSQVMQNQMKQLMDSWVPKGIKQVEVTKPEKSGEGSSNGGGLANTNSPSPAVENRNSGPPIVNAGTVSYGQLLTEANSDVPAPVLAQIVSGPLAGARAVGSFQIANGYNDYLVLTFTLADRKGKDFTIQAIALDPDTTLAGMATEVDQRYFTRVVLPAAAAFLQGFGSALGETSSSTSQGQNSTVVTQASPGLTQGAAQGAAAAAQTAAGFFQNQANITKPLVRIAAGTPIGLFFVKSVFSPSDQTAAQDANNGGCPAGTLPTYNVNGRVTSVDVPGAQVNGCVSNTNSSLGAGISPLAGLGPLGGLGTSGFNGYPQANALGANGSNLPYPNYGQPTNISRPYGSPYSSYGNSSPYGVSPYLGH